MSTLNLEMYEAAYERVERKLHLERDWGRLEARIRRRLRRPWFELAQTLGFILLCLTLGFLGLPQGWLLAAGLSLAVLPNRFARIRQRKEALAAVESSTDVQVLVHDEAKKRMGGAFTRALFFAVIGLLYIAVGILAAVLGKTPWPGLAAGSILLVSSAVILLVFFPRAARECESLETKKSYDDDPGDRESDTDA